MHKFIWKVLLSGASSDSVAGLMHLQDPSERHWASTSSLCPGSGCGGPKELSGESGTFSSSNYHDNYSDGVKCIWEITVEPDKVTWFSIIAFPMIVQWFTHAGRLRRQRRTSLVPPQWLCCFQTWCTESLKCSSKQKESISKRECLLSYLLGLKHQCVPQLFW